MSEATPPSSRKGSTTLLAAVALLVTFVAGVLVGAFGGRFLFLRNVERVRRPAAEFMMKRLDRTLDLTPQQEVEVTRILRSHHERIGAVWSGVRPQIRREVEQTNAEIERVLTPEQRAKFAGIKMRLMPRERHGIKLKHP